MLKLNSKFIMKILHKDTKGGAEKSAKQEASRWKSIWDVESRNVVVMGRDAGVMPFVHIFKSEANFWEHVNEVKDALLQMARLKHAHLDLRHNGGMVKREQVGFLRTVNSQKVVVVDLFEVKQVDSFQAAVSCMNIEELVSRQISKEL